MQLSKMQKEFWRKCNHRWNIKEGATRSGKTYLDYFQIARRLRALHGKEGLRVILGNTRGTVQRNIIDRMREIWGKEVIGEIKQSDNSVMMFGEKVYALGADKVSHVKSLQGAGFLYCYGDEITTWNEEVFNMVKSRLSYPDSVFDGTCNPDNPNHWFKKFLDSKADIYKQSYQIYDNPFLTKDFIKNLELEYEGTVYFNRFILGQWALAEGLIYQCFNKETDAIEKIEEPLNGKCFVSCDYGTQNPCVFLLWEQGKSGTWYLTDEYYYSGRDSQRTKTDQEYVNDFFQFTKDKLVRSVIVDPSAASFITALRQAGIRVKPAINDVVDGIRHTMGCINTGKIKVLSHCKDTISEFQSYSWDPKFAEDKPIKENDHAMDALRYFCYTILRERRGGVYAM